MNITMCQIEKKKKEKKSTFLVTNFLVASRFQCNRYSKYIHCKDDDTIKKAEVTDLQYLSVIFSRY